MTDPHDLLTKLAECARAAPSPKVDVRARVMESLSTRSTVLQADPAPLAFCGVAVALAASAVFAFLPFWQLLSEPWICYLPQ